WRGSWGWGGRGAWPGGAWPPGAGGRPAAPPPWTAGGWPPRAGPPTRETPGPPTPRTPPPREPGRGAAPWPPPSGASRSPRRRPDLMLLDLRLPVLDGWTVLEYARRSVVPPAVALMTVCSDAASIERALRAGIAGCVFKPFRIRDLVTTCDRILWKRGFGFPD